MNKNKFTTTVRYRSRAQTLKKKYIIYNVIRNIHMHRKTLDFYHTREHTRTNS